jgi:hypothetical protein
VDRVYSNTAYGIIGNDVCSSNTECKWRYCCNTVLCCTKSAHVLTRRVLVDLIVSVMCNGPKWKRFKIGALGLDLTEPVCMGMCGFLFSRHFSSSL